MPGHDEKANPFHVVREHALGSPPNRLILTSR
jgi:hypothetical protein